MHTNPTQLGAGQLVRWDGVKGFGFIRPVDGSKDVFVHISALPPGLVPTIGARLVFSAVDDARGRGQRAVKVIIDDAPIPAAAAVALRPQAASARPAARPQAARVRPMVEPIATRPTEQARGPRPRAAARPKRRDETLRALPLSALTFAVAAATLFCLWGALTALPLTPIPLIAYPAFSVLAVVFYARDKMSAIRGNWRVSESFLHLTEALGGWPGAYIAQQTMRHKTVKESYQVAFWLIVCAHTGAWGLWVFEPALIRSWVLAAMASAR